MKKFLLLSLCSLLMSFNALAGDKVILTPIKSDGTPVGNDLPKSPIVIPTVYIDNYSLLFEASHPEYVLNIKDENGDVVHTTTVYSTQTQVVLPSTLSGNYQIELVMGNWLFTGWIEL